jgi:hypothetical protein
MLVEFGMELCKPRNVPMHQNFKLIADMRNPFTNEILYRRKVGKLIYLTHTRPHIYAVVDITSRFLSSLQEASHMVVVDQFLQYVKGTINYGLSFQRASNYTLKGYVDCNWKLDRRWQSPKDNVRIFLLPKFITNILECKKIIFCCSLID